MSAYNDVEGSGDLVLIMPHDTNMLPGGITRGLYVGTGGNVRVLTEKNQDVVIPGLVTGQLYSFKVRQVFATNTTALNLMAVY